MGQFHLHPSTPKFDNEYFHFHPTIPELTMDSPIIILVLIKKTIQVYYTNLAFNVSRVNINSGSVKKKALLKCEIYELQLLERKLCLFFSQDVCKSQRSHEGQSQRPESFCAHV